MQLFFRHVPNTQPLALSIWCFFLLLTAHAIPVSADQNQRDFFENHIRPLIADHCIECHGPSKQEGGLRLDSRNGWQTGGDRGATIAPGDAANSLLMRAVGYEDPDLQMPPSEKLTAQQIADLGKWIRDGAEDPRSEVSTGSIPRLGLKEAQDFWSFKPLASRTPPNVESEVWSQQPIDAFIKQRLDKMGLTPVPMADRYTLIRRATFDLTGLPPSPREIRNFIEDTSPDAFAAVIDRLLSSPAYGERWGRHWLDIARYADTAGDGADYPVREASKYRDWVIRSFNADQPYDEFLRDQLAGDILAANEKTANYADGITATGFLAIGKRYGYKASPAFQHLDFADVIDSVGRSLLGLSIGCARCHDHKYDPISAADYYAWYGILQSTRWAFPGGEEQKRPANFPALVPPELASAREQARNTSLADLDRQIQDVDFEKQRYSPGYRAGAVDLGFESQKPGQPLAAPWVSSGPITVSPDSQSPFRHVHPEGKTGVRIGSGLQTDGIRYVFPRALNAESDSKLHFTIDFRTVESKEHPGAFRFYLGRGVVQSLAVEFSSTSRSFALRNGKQWQTIADLKPGTWYNLEFAIDSATRTYSGSIRSHGETTHFEKIATAPNWDGILDCFICDGFGHVEGSACQRDVDNVGLQASKFSAPKVADAHSVRTENQRQEKLQTLTSQLTRLTTERKSLLSQPLYPVAYAVSEAKPVNARVQLRGDPFRLGTEIERRNLEVLGGEIVAPNTGSGRLDLARWITSPTNPLTARVFVNRVWKWHFGQGIVTTPSDFGSRGASPTHPELLDWLASEFIKSGWSIKGLHRLIMLSRTYQLASDQHQRNSEIDPTNRFHWQFSRNPLDAECIRDGMLMVSGNMNRSHPDPHPFPPVETWGFTIHNPFHGVYESNHRSVYMMIQRNRRHPYLSLFDAADPNQSVAKRLPTTTPSQALFLMNSGFVHEQAENFARKIHSISGNAQTKLQWAFLAAHGRQPDQQMVQAGIEFLDAYQTRASGSVKVEQYDMPALTAFSRALLTSNQFLYLD